MGLVPAQRVSAAVIAVVDEQGQAAGVGDGGGHLLGDGGGLRADLRDGGMLRRREEGQEGEGGGWGGGQDEAETRLVGGGGGVEIDETLAPRRGGVGAVEDVDGEGV